MTVKRRKPRQADVLPRLHMPERYEVVAIAPTAAEIVHRAGALLCDRSMNGWVVTAFVDSCPDQRALTILGIDSAGVIADAHVARETGVSRTLVIAAEAISQDDRIRRQVLSLTKDCMTEILVCGPDRPRAMPTLTSVTYPSSSAAQLFKTHAQAVLGPLEVTRPPGGETFYRAGAAEQTRPSPSAEPVAR